MAASGPPRVTEMPSPLTENLDLASPLQALRLLSASDGLAFSGFGGLPGLFSEQTLDGVALAVRKIGAALQHPLGRVVIAGCGTSGRLAHLVSRGLNAWLRGQFGPGGG